MTSAPIVHSGIVAAGMNFILEQDRVTSGLRNRFLDEVVKLCRAFALAVVRSRWDLGGLAIAIRAAAGDGLRGIGAWWREGAGGWRPTVSSADLPQIPGRGGWLVRFFGLAAYAGSA